MRIFIHRTGKITWDNGQIVQRYYFPGTYPNFSVFDGEGSCNQISIIEYNFKNFAEIRTNYGEKANLYIDEELLKKEHKNFLSFLLNMIENVLHNKVDLPLEAKIHELEYVTVKNSRRIHHLLECLHDHHPKKRKEKFEPKEGYMRIVDLD